MRTVHGERRLTLTVLCRNHLAFGNPTCPEPRRILRRIRPRRQVYTAAILDSTLRRSVPLATTLEAFNTTLASARSTVAFRETINLALDSFCASKTRFLLTLLGMVIGSASIILVATLGLTGRQYALNMIASIGPNMIEMQYVGGSVAGPDNTSVQDHMTIEDLNAVVEQVPGIIASSPMLEDHERITMSGGVTKDAMFLGVSPQYKEVRNLKVLAGRFFDEQDSSSHTKVADIVLPMAGELYGSADAAVGRTISISGIPFTIIGVFKEGTETFGQSEISKQTMLIPYP